MLDLRVLEHFVDIVDRSAGHTGSSQFLNNSSMWTPPSSNSWFAWKTRTKGCQRRSLTFPMRSCFWIRSLWSELLLYAVNGVICSWPLSSFTFRRLSGKINSKLRNLPSEKSKNSWREDTGCSTKPLKSLSEMKAVTSTFLPSVSEIFFLAFSCKTVSKRWAQRRIWENSKNYGWKIKCRILNTFSTSMTLHTEASSTSPSTQSSHGLLRIGTLRNWT